MGWSVADVGTWLSQKLELPQYTAAFKEASVDGPFLVTLGDAELKDDVGVASKLHRMKIVRRAAMEASKSSGAAGLPVPDADIDNRRPRPRKQRRAHSGSRPSHRVSGEGGLARAKVRVMSCGVASRRVVSCRVVSCRVVSCRVVSCRVVSCRVVSCCVDPIAVHPRILTRRIMLPYLRVTIVSPVA
jgi:hypothetical protein